PVRLGADQLVEPRRQGLRGREVAAPDALDPLAQLADGQDAEIDLLGRDARDPGGHTRVTAVPLPELGDDVGVEEKAQSSTSRPRSGMRAKSASSPTSGIARSSSFIDLPALAGSNAWRRISRCSASAERP